MEDMSNIQLSIGDKFKQIFGRRTRIDRIESIDLDNGTYTASYSYDNGKTFEPMTQGGYTHIEAIKNGIAAGVTIKL